jgi:hypothetical protein
MRSRELRCSTARNSYPIISCPSAGARPIIDLVAAGSEPDRSFIFDCDAAPITGVPARLRQEGA